VIGPECRDLIQRNRKSDNKKSYYVSLTMMHIWSSRPREHWRDSKALAEALLLGGAKSPTYLKVALNALEKTLPHVRRVEFAGVGHLAADNSGKPELVAQVLRQFFGSQNETSEEKK